MKVLLPFLRGQSQPFSPAGRAGLKFLGFLGGLYGSLQSQRAELYRRRWLTAYRAPCPVLCVGNLSVGGTGKTPTVLWLAQHLLARRQAMQHSGGPLAIISRGYGTHAPHTKVVVVADPEGIRLTPPEAADEALLLARHLPGVVVLTGPDRAQLIRFAINQYGCDLVVMDDGFQHLKVYRDLDIVLVDAKHPFGNGYLLPGGILRERPSALKRCDIIVITRCEKAKETQHTQDQLAQIVPEKPLFLAKHQAQSWMRLGVPYPLPLSTLAQIPFLAFCGIAQPHSFGQTLSSLSLVAIIETTFPDHFSYTKKILQDLIVQARAVQAQALVCTEKDAVKIETAWLNTEAGPFPLYYVRLGLVFPAGPHWITPFLDRLGI